MARKNKSKYYEIRFAGQGGQGVILAGKVLGEAACDYFKHVSASSTYGPEVRGTTTTRDVILSDELIAFPRVTEPDIFIAMSQDAYDTYNSDIKPDGIVIYDSSIVNANKKTNNVKQTGIPATELASEIGQPLAANFILLGFLCAKTGILPLEAMEKAGSYDKNDAQSEINIRALRLGAQK